MKIAVYLGAYSLFKNALFMKNILIALLASIPALTIAQEDFTIKGKIASHNAPAKVYLQYIDGGQRKLDSAEIKNGQFTISGTVPAPVEAYVVLSPEGKPLRQLNNPDVNSIYLSKGVINLQGASLNEAKLTGNTLNVEYAKLKSLKKETEEALEAVNQEYYSATDEQREDENFVNGLREKIAPLFDTMKEIESNYVKSAQNYISLNIMSQNLGADNVLEYEGYFKSFPADLQSSDKGKALAERIGSLKTVAIGAIAPDFSLPDTAGNELALSSLRGQYVLVDFWASWCGPCRQENPNIVAAFNKYKDKGFTILGVSLDNPGKKDNWMKAIADDKLEQWPQVSDLKGWKSDAAKLYSVTSIPQNFLLDREGRIVASNLRGEALEAKLEELFK